MPTFVHAGDVHLDTPFSARLGAKQMELRRQEIRKTFRTIVEAARDKDFLLIAGDLFDSRFVSVDTIEFVVRCFRELKDTKVLIAAGNHDPNQVGSFYRKVDWGENVIVFGSEMEYYDFPSCKTRIHGKSFDQSHRENPVTEPLCLADGWCNLLLLHGDVVGDGGTSDYQPIEKGYLGRCGADYVALGHIHTKTELQRQGGTYYAYCGVPEGRGFDEEGEKGFYIGYAEKGLVQLEWQKSGIRHFWHLDLDISEMEDEWQIQDALIDAISAKGGKEDSYKVRLVGKAPQSFSRKDRLEEALSDHAFYLEIEDQSRPHQSPEAIAAENTLRGNFVATMLQRIETMPEEEKEIGRLALELGLNAMERGMSE